MVNKIQILKRKFTKLFSQNFSQNHSADKSSKFKFYNIENLPKKIYENVYPPANQVKVKE